jgi:hypothetical protein
MFFLACGGAGVLHNDHLVIAVVCVARGRLNRPCGADACKDEALDLVSSERRFQIGAVKGTDARLRYDDIREIGFQIRMKFGASGAKFDGAGLIGLAEERRIVRLIHVAGCEADLDQCG